MSYDKTDIQDLLDRNGKITHRGGEFYLNGNLLNRRFLPDLWDNLFFSLFDPAAFWIIEGGTRTLKNFGT